MPEPMTFKDRVAGKSAIITGAGSIPGEIGIGRAIALLLGREGAQVACADLDMARAEETAKQIEKAGGRAIALAGDVTSMADCERMVQEAAGSFGKLDILVNNVGVPTNMSLAEVTLESWHRIFDSNVGSAMMMCKFAIPEMVKVGGGSIVNITSVAGMRAMGSLGYGPSKAALHHLTTEICIMHGRQGIRANSVAPGHVMTPFVRGGGMSESMREARRKVGPLGIEGDAWDIAQATLFLASDDARFVNGVELAVDGGVSAIAALTGSFLVNGA